MPRGSKTKTKSDGNKPEAATMTWEDFTAQKGRRGTRTSKYGTFVSEMEAETVYDATALFPDAKTETLGSAIYGQAKKQNRKVQTIIRDGRLFVALA